MQRAKIIGVKFKGILLRADDQIGEPPIGSICHNATFGHFIWPEDGAKSLSKKYFSDFQYPALTISHFHIITDDVINIADWYVFQDSIIQTDEKVYSLYQATKLRLDWREKVNATYFKIVASTMLLHSVPSIPHFLLNKILYRVIKTNSIINI
jgi:hypothetical protein